MPDAIPEDHFDSAASCLVACDDGLSECTNKGTPPGTCEMSFRDCTDDCDRSKLIAEL
jgi:hypothetical protein